jgi:hypothetical protein
MAVWKRTVAAGFAGLLLACSGAVAPLGGTGPDGGGTGACSTDTDCGGGKVCGFATADACAAKGTCFDAPPPGAPECLLYAPGCACDGTQVALACNGYPSGYAAKPVLHSGTCSADAGGGGPCTSDAQCGSGFLCGYAIAQGCSAQGVCVAANMGALCNLFVPGCACNGQTVGIGCTRYPDGYAAEPILHTGACEGIDAGGRTFGCGPYQCQVGSEVCKVGVGGPAGAPPSYQCIPFPASCAATPTCTCVQQSEGAQLCSGDAGNGITITFEYP